MTTDLTREGRETEQLQQILREEPGVGMTAYVWAFQGGSLTNVATRRADYE
jgi:hypothetical protein